jgi:ankyrin repeat protein
LLQNLHLVELINLLSQQGVNFEAKNNYGETGFIVACQRQNIEVIKLLIKQGVNIEAKNHTGFIDACSNDHIKIVHLLIQEGANIEAKDNYGETGFICACSNDHIKIVHLLIQEGANIEAKDNYGKNGFIRACSYGHFETIALLIHHGTDVQVKIATMFYDKTGFDFLNSNQKQELKELLENKISKNILVKETLKEFWIDESDCDLQIINTILEFHFNQINFDQALKFLE